MRIVLLQNFLIWNVLYTIKKVKVFQPDILKLLKMLIVRYFYAELCL